MISKHIPTFLLIAISALFIQYPGNAIAAGPLVLKTLPGPSGVELSALLAPQAEAWHAAAEQPVKFSRTPPLYDGDPSDDGQRPTATVKLIRLADKTVVVRCHWTDATEDRVEPGVRFPDAGQQHIYVEHSVATDKFADAFCVMLPKTRGAQASYPLLMMGDTQNPVDLYFWRAGKGFEFLNAHGRTTTAPAGKPVGEAGAHAAPPDIQGQALREADGWTVVMAIPNATPETPVCFAVWDGAKLHRDGLKFFSLWYELE